MVFAVIENGIRVYAHSNKHSYTGYYLQCALEIL